MRSILAPLSLAVVLLFAACTRKPIQSPDQALRPIEKWTERYADLPDDLDFSTLPQALLADARQLRARKSDAQLSFGAQKISAREYAGALEHLAAAAKQDPSGAAFRRELKEGFFALEVFGQDHWGEVFLTSYYEPVIEGSSTARGPFTAPILGMPKDLVEIDVGSFAAARPALSVLSDGKLEQRSAQNILRGRLIASRDPAQPSRVVAFPDRAGIVGGELKSDSRVLAYADPIDLFFLEIQGSGVVRLKEGGELKVGYAAQNGYPYVPIGKFLLDKIPKEKMSQQAIETHLRAMPAEQARALMARNPSYVFFKPLKTAGIAFFGTEVVAGRTIATDQAYFPKGALAFLEFEKPQFANPEASEPAGFQKTSRFVLDQDTGGAIRGPGRVDLFWGRGSEARQTAGVMRGKGRLMYFLPRPEYLAKLVATRSAALE